MKGSKKASILSCSPTDILCSCDCPQITIYILLATALIITGCILLVVFGDHSSAVYTGQQLLALYNE